MKEKGFLIYCAAIVFVFLTLLNRVYNESVVADSKKEYVNTAMYEADTVQEPEDDLLTGAGNDNILFYTFNNDVIAGETDLINSKDVSFEKPDVDIEWFDPLESGRVTSRFGFRINPVTDEYKLHKGYDIGANSGSLIYAVASGRVTYAGYDSGYGNYVVVQHGEGIKTLYAHCSEICVEKNDTVEAGAVIARVGSTGNSTGPHLHLELLINGKRYDPEWVFGGLYD